MRVYNTRTNELIVRVFLTQRDVGELDRDRLTFAFNIQLATNARVRVRNWFAC